MRQLERLLNVHQGGVDPRAHLLNAARLASLEKECLFLRREVARLEAFKESATVLLSHGQQPRLNAILQEVKNMFPVPAEQQRGERLLYDLDEKRRWPLEVRAKWHTMGTPEPVEGGGVLSEVLMVQEPLAELLSCLLRLSTSLDAGCPPEELDIRRAAHMAHSMVFSLASLEVLRPRLRNLHRAWAPFSARLRGSEGFERAISAALPANTKAAVDALPPFSKDKERGRAAVADLVARCRWVMECMAMREMAVAAELARDEREAETRWKDLERAIREHPPETTKMQTPRKPGSGGGGGGGGNNLGQDFVF
jgi:hypothetical protein